MSTIFLPQKSRRGDTLSGASIDRGDPLNNGLIFAFAPGATGSITKESVKGAVGSIAGTAEFRGDSFSGAKSYSENNTSWIAFPDSPELDSADITVFAIVTPRVGTGIKETQVAARNYDGSKVPFNFQLYNATAVLSGFGFFDGAWKNVAFSGTFSDNERVSVAGRNAGGTLAVFKNGALNNSSTGNGACPSGTAGIAVGSYVNDSVGFNGGIHCVYVWRRALSDGEIAQLHAEPFRVFSKQSRVIYFPSAGGGGATLTADSGTYTLTGTAATLKADRKLAADSGSYAITGTDVSLKLGRKLTAESGTYTVNGTDVSLTAGRKLTADSGTYALTGTDVTLTYQPAGGYTLALDSGSYTLTGTAATLKASRKLTADSGTYALTGTDVTLTRGFKITADSGTYTLTGSNVAFARTYRLPADSGSYALSGSPVSLSWSGEVVPVAPTHGGPSIYGKAVFREAEFKREYEREVSRIENERIRAIQMREDEELVIIMAALAA